ncbi:hypothetical protein [Pseudomonas sp. P105]|uniref:hypothetical protein n=1 Tax=Pseudomonas sp. P105 TaxID=3049542 RepID=UPI00293461AC|nr:hypothetical protein [Pseudomonas sp. P105]WNZ77127.1 hypothetical protein QOM08_20785 [Pseudomonas sp. P105]
MQGRILRGRLNPGRVKPADPDRYANYCSVGRYRFPLKTLFRSLQTTEQAIFPIYPGLGSALAVSACHKQKADRTDVFSVEKKRHTRALILKKCSTTYLWEQTE